MSTSSRAAARPALWRRLRNGLAVAAGVMASASAMAGFITLNEASMDSIFSQASFGANSIDIRFNAPLTLVKPSLLSVDNWFEFDELKTLAAPGSKTVSMFFADNISWCGDNGPNYVGCAATPGQVLVLKSSTAANASLGGVLAAHELAHNLGLEHVGSSGNLLNPVLTGSSFLSQAQVSSLLSSPLIQFDGAQRFIAITPIALVAQVPEPASWAMLGLGVLALGWRRRAPAA